MLRGQVTDSNGKLGNSRKTGLALGRTGTKSARSTSRKVTGFRPAPTRLGMHAMHTAMRASSMRSRYSMSNNPVDKTETNEVQLDTRGTIGQQLLSPASRPRSTGSLHRAQ